MAEIVADCPRCGAKKITFSVKHGQFVGTDHWQQYFELYSLCRNCGKGSILKASQREYGDGDFFQKYRDQLHTLDLGLTRYLQVNAHVSLSDRATVASPDFVPDDVRTAFNEGAKCTAVSCPNAAAAMFRLSVDLATSPLLPAEDVDGLNRRTRRDLGLRLPWLFDTGRLPEALRELASCIKDDGNDAAHRGNLTQDDANDLLDFAQLLLERLYTEPGRLEEAAQRRESRKIASQTS